MGFLDRHFCHLRSQETVLGRRALIPALIYVLVQVLEEEQQKQNKNKKMKVRFSL